MIVADGTVEAPSAPGIGFELKRELSAMFETL